jgi:hypothetical protein
VLHILTNFACHHGTLFLRSLSFRGAVERARVQIPTPASINVYATEGSQMILRRATFFLAVSWVSRLPVSLRKMGLPVTILLVAFSGCRTPWRAMDNEPSFDRLLELEQRSSPGLASRNGMASRLRPGVRNYEGSFLADPSGRPAGQPEQIASTKETNVEQMLADVPSGQRELVRREIEARQARAVDLVAEKTDDLLDKDSRHTTLSKSVSDRDELSVAGPVTFQISDSVQNSEVADANWAEPSQHKLAAQDFARQLHSSIERKGGEDVRVRSSNDTVQPVSSALLNNTADANPVTAAAGRLPAEDSSVVVSTHTETQSRPSDRAGELDWKQHVQQALKKLKSEPQGSSPEEKSQLSMIERLLHLSLGDLNSAMEPVDGLQLHGQEFVRHSLESLYEVTNPSGNPVEIKRYTLAMLSQRKALNHLAAVSNLEVRNAAFCTEVEGFGIVTKFPQYNFRADQELLLYCELDNFVSTPKEGVGFETQLQGSYEIVDTSGRRVADQLLPMDSHLCRNQRRDYFIAYRVYMPQNINPGKYQLKLTIEDMKGRKFGQSAIDFQIVQELAR